MNINRLTEREEVYINASVEKDSHIWTILINLTYSVAHITNCTLIVNYIITQSPSA